MKQKGDADRSSKEILKLEAMIIEQNKKQDDFLNYLKQMSFKFEPAAAAATSSSSEVDE